MISLERIISIFLNKPYFSGNTHLHYICTPSVVSQLLQDQFQLRSTCVDEVFALAHFLMGATYRDVRGTKVKKLTGGWVSEGGLPPSQ